ncbi:MAG TPA: hypothetical protein VNL94_00295 [Candidatus Binatia bacterium]|nr:hypothetical protein [Candidatus Binatia bacterium]
MPGRGNAGGNAGGHGHGHGGQRDERGQGPGNDDETRHGRSQWSPGHQKKAAGEQSATDVGPGHGEEPPPRQFGRTRGENATETPQPDSFERES